MRYFIVAGEASGDLHGSNLIRGLLEADPGAEIECWGGDLMERAGAKLLKHYRDAAFMGFVAVVLNIRTIAANLALCKKQIAESAPDVVILIDYPGFNFKIAEHFKNSGIKVFYYISPKLWAWKESRVEKVRRFVDKMFIIFPFEVEFYRKHGISVEYYGNPLVDETVSKIQLYKSRTDLIGSVGLGNEPVITLLAGSRKHEVKHILPAMVKVVKHFPGYRFVLATVDTIPEEYYRNIIGDSPVTIIAGKTYELLLLSEAALVKSGTSTLEAALMNIPQVVCYAGDPVSFAIARSLVKIKYISLVNLIMGREVVKELIQHLLTENNIRNELSSILYGGSKRDKMLSDYDELRSILGPEGASARISSEMVKYLRSQL